VEHLDSLKRCGWAFSAKDPLLLEYHDKEWGVPIHDDRLLFEFLVLEGAQAGLSWLTILRKRENYRRAFDFFDPSKVEKYGQSKVQELLQNQGIVRNKLKISAAIQNARACQKVTKEFGSFSGYVWSFVPNKEPRRNKWRTLSQIPVTTRESDDMSKDMIRRGFRFVGSTICYSFMQATGLVNDHTTGCFRYKQV
jgi:DNA-3-methyladenine glycosylase I